MMHRGRLISLTVRILWALSSTKVELLGTFNHKLRTNKGSSRPRFFLFVDTETDQTKQSDGGFSCRLKLGWCVLFERGTAKNRQREVWHYFTTIDQFWSFVAPYIKPKTRLCILSFNLAFDFTILGGFSHMSKMGFSPLFFYFSSQTNIIKFRTRDHQKGSGSLTVLFLDLGNWYKGKLSALGDLIGKPKGEVSFETASDAELCIYCFRDVEIMLDAFRYWLDFIDLHDLGSFGMTLPSQAFKAFTHRFLKPDLFIHANRPVLDLERAGYHGGRVECYRLGYLADGPYYMLDVNSLYPYVMSVTDVPIRLKFRLKQPSIKQLSSWLDDYAVVARVGITTDTPAYVHQHKTHLCWPIGDFVSVLNTPELRFALDQGVVTWIDEVTLYEKARLFDDYVAEFYSLRLRYRQQQNPVYVKICKLLLNSLYGKFGQKCESWKPVDNMQGYADGAHTFIDAQTGIPSRLIVLSPDAWEVTTGKDSINSFPAICGHITSAARLVLWDYMVKAGRENVFYCDTDSMLVNQAGMDRLKPDISAETLGKLKVEYKTKRAIIRGPKDYRTDHVRRRKGIRPNAQRIAPKTYRQELWPGFRTLMAEGKTDVYTVRKITKRLVHRYQKGHCNKDGTVEPLQFMWNSLISAIG